MVGAGNNRDAVDLTAGESRVECLGKHGSINEPIECAGFRFNQRSGRDRAQALRGLAAASNTLWRDFARPRLGHAGGSDRLPL